MLTALDWIIIIVAMAGMFMIALSFKNAASRDLSSFFLGGRNLPWYIAGLSMVATTFAADTPLAVTEIVGKDGISGNWIWWNFLIGGMLTVFFFSRLWRRAEILTEVEFIELRYGGRPASWLRGFKGIYLGLFMNVLVIGWVNLAMATILEVFFGLSSESALYLCGIGMLIAGIYTSVSGLLGVAITDVIQFFLAMTGSILLAWLVIDSPEIGGLSGLAAKVPEGTLQYFPHFGDQGETDVLTISLGAFIAFFGFIWWASWYPGAEPGGGGYISQRMMSTRDEPSALKATLLFQIAHYCIRPWPWILVGLAAIHLYSVSDHITDATLRDRFIEARSNIPSQELWADEPMESWPKGWENDRTRIEKMAMTDPQLDHSIRYEKDTRFGYVLAMKDHLPSGWLGLMLVAFFSAYLSTISTQLNWGASYLVNDVYKRFMEPEAGDQKLIRASRVTTLLLMVAGLITSFFIESISGVWTFLMECGAGLGLVLILRWFWWRINVWSEITATVAPFVGYSIGHFILGWEFPNSFFFTVGLTTLSWLIVTLITPPEKDEVLDRFHARVRPGGWWGRRGSSGFKESRWMFLGWISSIVFTYNTLFLIGDLLLRSDGASIGRWITFLVSLSLMWISLRRMFRSPKWEGSPTTVEHDE
ncbi:MAG: Na+:solute symporter [Bacteroidota bacterium]|nr:Na+:solute symporter [Bacteroidota bacterium]MDX5505150.1 Na+:solute symporter [Bacteroidota bacterium]